MSEENKFLDEIEKFLPETTSDNDDDEFESSSEDVLAGQQYAKLDKKDVIIDPHKGEVIDKKDLTPFQIIKSVAESTGTKVQDPRPGCKHCYGRGFVGYECTTNMPIPCSCIYPARSPNKHEQEKMYDNTKVNGKFNRDQRRKLQKMLVKNIRKTNRANVGKMEQHATSASPIESIITEPIVEQPKVEIVS
jgi:hypothetical protein